MCSRGDPGTPRPGPVPAKLSGRKCLLTLRVLGKRTLFPTHFPVLCFSPTRRQDLTYRDTLQTSSVKAPQTLPKHCSPGSGENRMPQGSQNTEARQTLPALGKVRPRKGSSCVSDELYLPTPADKNPVSSSPWDAQLPAAGPDPDLSWILLERLP